MIVGPRTSYGGLIHGPLSQMSLRGIIMIDGHLTVESVKQSIVREAVLKQPFSAAMTYSVHE